MTSCEIQKLHIRKYAYNIPRWVEGKLGCMWGKEGLAIDFFTSYVCSCICSLYEIPSVSVYRKQRQDAQNEILNAT